MSFWWVPVSGGHSVWLPYLALLGLGVGYVAGMFGVGGGFLLTPFLISVFGVPPAIAVGSALSQKCGTSISSFLKYRQYKLGEPKIDFIMLPGSILGVDLGTRLLSHLDGLGRQTVLGHEVSVVKLAVDLLFLVLLGTVAIYTALEVASVRHQKLRGDVTIPGPLTRVRIPPYVDLPGVGLTSFSVPVLVFLGLILGVASGIMGIGGGVLFMPILLYGFGLSARNAAATGIIVLLVTVSVGTFEQALHGFVDLRLALGILIGSSIGSQFGALTTTKLKNRTLRLLFSIMVMLTVVLIAWDIWGMLHQSAIR